MRARVIDAAQGAGVHSRAYMSVVFGCPYKGPVQPIQVQRVASSCSSWALRR